MHLLLLLYQALVHSDVPNIIQDVSGIVALWALRKFNCKVSHCWRFGRHTVNGTTYHTCTKHAVTDVHTALQAQHAVERPEQHKLLNEGNDVCTSAVDS